MQTYPRFSPLRAKMTITWLWPGDDLRESLAAIFNILLSEKTGDEKLKAKLEKYNSQENVMCLRTLRDCRLATKSRPQAT